MKVWRYGNKRDCGDEVLIEDEANTEWIAILNGSRNAILGRTGPVKYPRDDSTNHQYRTELNRDDAIAIVRQLSRSAAQHPHEWCESLVSCRDELLKLLAMANGYSVSKTKHLSQALERH